MVWPFSTDSPVLLDLDDLQVGAADEIPHVVHVDAAGAQPRLDHRLIHGGGELTEQRKISGILRVKLDRLAEVVGKHEIRVERTRN